MAIFIFILLVNDFEYMYVKKMFRKNDGNTQSNSFNLLFATLNYLVVTAVWLWN